MQAYLSMILYVYSVYVHIVVLDFGTILAKWCSGYCVLVF